MSKITIDSRIRTLLMTIILLGVAAGAKAAAPDGQTSSSQPADLVPLELKLPKLIITPATPDIFLPDHPTPTLDRSDIDKKREPLMVPKDVKLLSANKKVTSSNPEPPIGELSMITDGDKDSMDGSIVELGPNVQWVQIDLGAPAEIYAVAIWHYHLLHYVFHDVIVRAANNPDFAPGVNTLFNNDYNNSAGFGIGKDKEYVESYQGKLIDTGKADRGKPVKARYLRFYSNGSSYSPENYYCEIEVFGRPLK